MCKRRAALILILTAALTSVSNPSTSLYAQDAPAANIKNRAKTSEARALLRHARTIALRITNNNFQRDRLLDQIGAAQARAGDLDAAVQTANEAASLPPTSTLDEVGRQLAKTNDLTSAQALGVKLKEGGVSAILANLVDAQANQGQIYRALKAAELIGNSEIRSYALEKIATRQAVDGDGAGARKTFMRARESHPSGLVSVDELEGLIVARELSRVQTLEARKRLEVLKSPDSKFFLMIALAEDFWQKGDHTSAGQWFAEALKELPAGPQSDFLRYWAIPYRVRFGQKESGMLAAGALSTDLRVKGYMAVAITCAEIKDVVGVNAAVNKMRLATGAKPNPEVSYFGLKLMILNVTAALIDNGQLDEAGRLLSTLEEQTDDVSYKMGIEPGLQLQRVLILALTNQFVAARSLAMKMQPESIINGARGTALRITALLQTRQSGLGNSLSWSRKLVNIQDRTHALLGISQALLEIDEVKLGYSAIQVH